MAQILPSVALSSAVAEWKADVRYVEGRVDVTDPLDREAETPQKRQTMKQMTTLCELPRVTDWETTEV